MIPEFVRYIAAAVVVIRIHKHTVCPANSERTRHN